MFPLVLVVLAVVVLPEVLAAFTNHSAVYLLKIAVFGALALLYMPVYFLWLARQQRPWAKALSVACTFGLATLYTAFFADEFSNAYLVFVLAVQIVFALDGPGPGIAILALSVVANVVEVFSLRNPHIEANVFALTVLVAVGLLTWYFVSTADHSREEAENLTQEVTKLNRLILTSQDNERRRLARDIHDGPLQSMGVELLAIDRARRRLDAGEYDKALQELGYLRSVAEETVDDLRQTVNTLRNTLLDSGLEPALANFVRKLHDSGDIAVTLEIDTRREIPRPLQTCLYQLVTEALNNVKKHAAASKALVRIGEEPGAITLLVRDDGRGFDYETSAMEALSEGHIGLHTMRERAAELGGTMQVRSRPAQGTELWFTFPLSMAHAASTSLASDDLTESV
jgi:signal transduction histidine kinase